MKKLCLLLSGILLLFGLTACSEKNYVLNEKNWFLVMTNIQYYPEEYVNKDIEYDCFTYKLTDVNGQEYICGVRKCSSEYGCACGNDTVIGFILNYDGEIPKPIKQSENTNEKAWVKLKGTLPHANKTTIEIYAYNADGSINTGTTEFISFLEFTVQELSVITDYSNLNYYVTK